MKIKIIGKGSFGNFLSKEFSDDLSETPDAFILAIPFDGYDHVAKSIVDMFGKESHLVNVCSVQDETNHILLKHSKNVTGIHPLFGERSSKNREDRISIVTLKTDQSEGIINLFSKISVIKDNDVNGKIHDIIMAKTHLKVIQVADQIQKIVNDAHGIPEHFLTPSFKKMKELSEQCLDMPIGTRNSILSNKN